MILFCGFVEDSLTCSSNKNSDIFRGRFRILMLRAVWPAWAEFTAHNVALVVPEQGIATIRRELGRKASDEHSLRCS
jgi:hypothetical protein